MNGEAPWTPHVALSGLRCRFGDPIPWAGAHGYTITPLRGWGAGATSSNLSQQVATARLYCVSLGKKLAALTVASTISRREVSQGFRLMTEY